MLNNKILAFVDRLLRDVCGINLPLGGKTVILGGDWKQLTTIAEHGTREAQIEQSIKMHPLFKKFEKLRYLLIFRFI